MKNSTSINNEKFFILYTIFLAILLISLYILQCEIFELKSQIAKTNEDMRNLSRDFYDTQKENEKLKKTIDLLYYEKKNYSIFSEIVKNLNPTICVAGAITLTAYGFAKYACSLGLADPFIVFDPGLKKTLISLYLLYDRVYLEKDRFGVFLRAVLENGKLIDIEIKDGSHYVSAFRYLAKMNKTSIADIMECLKKWL